MEFKFVRFQIKGEGDGDPVRAFSKIKPYDYYATLSAQEITADTYKPSRGKLGYRTENYKTRKGAVNAINKLAQILGIKERAK